MQQLAKEGKKIAAIHKQDFPKLNYWDVYVEVYGASARSALGVKRMITNRINDVAASKSKAVRAEIAAELHDLVWHCGAHSAARSIRQSFEFCRAD